MGDRASGNLKVHSYLTAIAGRVKEREIAHFLHLLLEWFAACR